MPRVSWGDSGTSATVGSTNPRQQCAVLASGQHSGRACRLSCSAQETVARCMRRVGNDNQRRPTDIGQGPANPSADPLAFRFRWVVAPGCPGSCAGGAGDPGVELAVDVPGVDLDISGEQVVTYPGRVECLPVLQRVAP